MSTATTDRRVVPGRHSAHIDGDFVVFLIGMRPNRPWKPHRWLPVITAMQRMIRELEADPDSGFLGATQGFLTTGPMVVQYWRSFEHLDRFARNPDARHLAAWKRFNRRVKGSGNVGIWHETYLVRAGEYEAIYGDMPRVGLAAAGRHVPIATKGQTAARRIHRDPRALHGATGARGSAAR
jgi:Domain of unknown function (DUF4188)